MFDFDTILPGNGTTLQQEILPAGYLNAEAGFAPGEIQPFNETITTTAGGSDEQIIDETVTSSDPSFIGMFSGPSPNLSAVSNTFEEKLPVTADSLSPSQIHYAFPSVPNGVSVLNTITLTTKSVTSKGVDDSNTATLALPIVIVTAPAVTGNMASQSDGDQPISPFSNIKITDADATFTNDPNSPFVALDDATISVTDSTVRGTDADGLLSGSPDLMKLGAGNYKITGVTPSVLTTDLAALSFVPIPGSMDKTTAFKLTVSDELTAGLPPPGLTTVVTTNVTTSTAPPPSPPTIAGIPATQNDADGPISPFSAVVITDTQSGAMDSATIAVSGGMNDTTPIESEIATDGEGTLVGNGLTKTGTGTYTIAAASPSGLSSELAGLTFTPVVGATATNPKISLGVTDTVDGLSGNASTIVMTPAPTPPPPPGDLTVLDTSTGKFLDPQNGTPQETPYTGPVAGITNQYINITQDNVNITATTPNWFLHSGGGEDALQAFGGTNVLDGGTGSNFLVGGKGTGEFDTFFVDARGATADIWSTMVNFASGDNATMWGITASMFNIAMVDNDGAAGFTGLTFHATAAGSPEASLTLTGFTQADLTNGKITETFGTDPASGSPYMAIHAT